MIWRFSDGTAAHLGGTIEGGSAFAQELRAALADDPRVALEPLPCPGVALDAKDPTMFDCWLSARAAWHERSGLTMTERPADIPPLPEQPESDDDEPGTVY